MIKVIATRKITDPENFTNVITDHFNKMIEATSNPFSFDQNNVYFNTCETDIVLGYSIVAPIAGIVIISYDLSTKIDIQIRDSWLEITYIGDRYNKSIIDFMDTFNTLEVWREIKPTKDWKFRIVENDNNDRYKAIELPGIGKFGKGPAHEVEFKEHQRELAALTVKEFEIKTLSDRKTLFHAIGKPWPTGVTFNNKNGWVDVDDKPYNFSFTGLEYRRAATQGISI
ncbi:MAG: hypothetical protein GY804_08760 [Alphaproteobacteria bacterium]|nr:hypothetical protein [Alphaproteobacteria bacterium]